jgi:hypothetical protein
MNTLKKRIPGLPLMALLISALVGMSGCRSLGPRTIPHDRFDYSSALADSWKSMMLLNIVKTRYLDLPIFLDVGQVVSGYTLETSGTVGGSVNESGAAASPGNGLVIGGSARYSQQPTITYTPLTGDKFLEGFLHPVDPARVFALVQSGYAADFVLQLGLDSLNGLRNQPVVLGSKYQADPEFFRVLALLREIQDARAVGMRVERATNGLPATLMFFRRDRVEPEVQQKIVEVQGLLGLAPGQSEFRLVSSPLRGVPGELSVGTRSLWQMLAAMSLGVQIPPKHQERRLTPPLPEVLSSESLLLHIHSAPAKPADAYVAVPYEGHWFWIANDDWKSKRTFTSILFLFTLADTGASQNMPALTIPTR